MESPPRCSVRENAPAIPDIPCRVEDFGVDGIPSREQLLEFWDSCRPWLAWNGLTLYELRYRAPDEKWWGKVWLCPRTSATTSSLPFSTCLVKDNETPRFVRSTGDPACAQDRMGRDVMLKLVDKGSVEHNINRLLLQDASSLAHDATFPCVIAPVAILDTPHNYSFVVMPMWANPIHVEDLRSLKDVLQFIRCLLRGLAYLHCRRIAHRDICEHNILVNIHSPGAEGEYYRELLREYRRDHEVLYAFMDYDQSLQLPPETSLTECRRPAQEATAGGGLYRSSDMYLGEPVYNPFAFDVGALGMMFRYYFAGVVSELPGLAALFDRMTDHSIQRRYTAEQALVLFDDIVSPSSRDTLKTPITVIPEREATNDADVYWRKLSREDTRVWGMYRTLPRPFFERVLDWVTAYRMGWKIVYYIRRMLQL